jgi:hypothetical protein
MTHPTIIKVFYLIRNRDSLLRFATKIGAFPEEPRFLHQRWVQPINVALAGGRDSMHCFLGDLKVAVPKVLLGFYGQANSSLLVL